MAVQQNKKSPSKRGMHRSHNALNVPNGFYRGRQVLKNKSEA
jgi:large subunit ribosomal protein L32